jgi:phosphoglycolate phosphatase-like HAD superfamily hydrolase
MPRSPNPAILFDLDGTLIDSVYEHVIAWAAALRSVGIVVPNWKIHRRIGMNGKSMVPQLIREPEVKRATVKIGPLEEKHDAAFRKEVSNLRLVAMAQWTPIRLRCRSNSRAQGRHTHQKSGTLAATRGPEVLAFVGFVGFVNRRGRKRSP